MATERKRTEPTIDTETMQTGLFVPEARQRRVQGGRRGGGSSIEKQV